MILIAIKCLPIRRVENQNGAAPAGNMRLARPRQEDYRYRESVGVPREGLRGTSPTHRT